MKASEFFADRVLGLLFRAVFAAVTAVFLLLTGTKPGIVVILGIVWFLVLACGQAVDFFRCRSRLRELYAVMEGLDKKYLFAECVRAGGTVYERRLFELFHRAGRAMISAVSDAEACQREYREYVESFVHEVKTPITAAELICRKMDEKNRRKLSCELAKIGAHVERALFYARSESVQKDYIVREETLRELVAQAVGEHRTLLAGSGMRVETGDLEYTVFTDRKWAVFLLGQLLQNSARYCGEKPVVVISGERDYAPGENPVQGIAKAGGGQDSCVTPRRTEAACVVARSLASGGGGQVRLTVRDNGIGIPAHELPRVFERGFTGRGGRERGGSTGMGLYLCRRLADCLGIGLAITSECGMGTTVTLTFAAKKEAVMREEEAGEQGRKSAQNQVAPSVRAR
ncbi:MAG: HAMP domain-containing histidine kinase [Lachnospiraceae bacterium]|nr:HAMP domain-containing histidine kinase [Lachnospiraceae bacterium]